MTPAYKPELQGAHSLPPYPWDAATIVMEMSS